ncbi:hypothetical protein PIB30_090866, partial [Stylosanthes scabra]|nr:hypothetical protein [Stylosanthes scabra]
MASGSGSVPLVTNLRSEEALGGGRRAFSCSAARTFPRNIRATSSIHFPPKVSTILTVLRVRRELGDWQNPIWRFRVWMELGVWVFKCKMVNGVGFVKLDKT